MDLSQFMSPRVSLNIDDIDDQTLSQRGIRDDLLENYNDNMMSDDEDGCCLSELILMDEAE